MIDTTIGGGPAHEASGLSAEQIETSDFDTLNDLLQQAVAAKSLNEVMAEAASIHERTRAAVARIDWGKWRAGVRAQRPLLSWIAGDSYEHYLEHWQWLPLV